LDQTKSSLIAGTMDALEFFSSIAEIIIPDNLKSALTKADKYDPEIIDAFQDTLDH
jgi:hypothetical protein